MRRQELSQAIQAEGMAASPRRSEHMLYSDKKNVSLFKNRFAAFLMMFKNAGASVVSLPSTLAARRQEKKEAKQKAKQEKQVLQSTAKEVQEKAKKEKDQDEELLQPTRIEQPTSGWREKVLGFRKKTAEGIGSAKQNMAQVSTRIKQRRQAEAIEEDEAVETPQVSVKKVEEKAGEEELKDSKQVTTAKKIQEEAEEKKEEEQRSSIVGFLRKEKEAERTPLGQAQESIQKGEYQAAEDILVPHIIKHTKDTKAYMLLGRVALAKQEWNEAMEIFKQAIRINSDTPGSYAGLGFAALKAGRYTRALEALQRAHDADPENVKVLHNLLHIAQRMDNRVLQHSVLERLSKLEPENEEYATALKHFEETKSRAT